MGGVRTVKPYTRAAGPPAPAPRALTVPSLWTAHALYRSIDYTFPSFGSLPNPGPRPEHFSQARAHFLQNRSICSDCHSSMRLLISRGVIGCAVLPTEWDSKGGHGARCHPGDRRRCRVPMGVPGRRCDRYDLGILGTTSRAVLAI
jgi:hypothetical protein